jgi:hypothetical protein
VSKLDVVVDAARGARKVAKVDDVAKGTVDTARAQSSAGARTTLQQAIYDHNASLKSEGYTETLKPLSLDPVKEVEELEAVRQRNIYEPDADVDHFYQTRGQEEFEQRMFKQLYSPDYGARSARSRWDEELVPPPPKELVAEALMEDFVFQVKMTGGILKNRVLKRAIDWLGDSPYRTTQKGRAPRVFVHIDRQTDPTRVDDFIQFDEPLEMGLHSGTNQAAIEATLPGSPGVPDSGPELARLRGKDFDDSLAELFGYSDNAKENLAVFYKTLEEHFIRKFNKGGDLNWELWEETENILKGALADIGAPTSIAAQYIAKAKQLSTASSTPHLFRGKNGLYLNDSGGFKVEDVAKQLKKIFPDDEDAINAAMGAVGSVPKQKALQKFIEEQGFDHIVYHNSIEDRGTLSIINWNRDLYMPLLDKRLVGGDGGVVAAKVAMAMAAVGLGVKVQVPEGG